MKQTIISAAQLEMLAARFPFAWLTTDEAVTVGVTPPVLPWQTLAEAVFFGPEGQLQVTRCTQGLRAVLLQDEPQDEFLPEEQRRLLPAFGGVITVRQAVEYDADGQACRGALRLLCWKEEPYAN